MFPADDGLQVDRPLSLQPTLLASPWAMAAGQAGQGSLREHFQPG